MCVCRSGVGRELISFPALFSAVFFCLFMFFFSEKKTGQVSSDFFFSSALHLCEFIFSMMTVQTSARVN